MKQATDNLSEPETHYVWRELVHVDGEDRLLYPWRNPHKHEHPFVGLFASKEKAIEGLDTFGATDEAAESGWILCRATETPLLRLAPDEDET
jgi:hypothetical protein